MKFPCSLLQQLKIDLTHVRYMLSTDIIILVEPREMTALPAPGISSCYPSWRSGLKEREKRESISDLLVQVSLSGSDTSDRYIDNGHAESILEGLWVSKSIFRTHFYTPQFSDYDINILSFIVLDRDKWKCKRYSTFRGISRAPRA